jgi:tetratricopeptide (TPR) repeat protein
MHPSTHKPYRLSVVILTLGLALSGPVKSSAYECAELEQGKFYADYADPKSSEATGADPMGLIKRVENVHFNSEMKKLNLKLYSIERLVGEINYTLGALPNNPGALLAMSRLETMAGGKLPAKLSADCFFDRAIRFRPKDKAVRMVHGMHLHRHGKLKEALAEYELAESLGNTSANLYYNLGLLHADMKNWDKAYEYGVKSQGAGLMLPGLRGKLQKAGRPLPAPVHPEKTATPELSSSSAVEE